MIMTAVGKKGGVVEYHTVPKYKDRLYDMFKPPPKKKRFLIIETSEFRYHPNFGIIRIRGKLHGPMKNQSSSVRTSGKLNQTSPLGQPSSIKHRLLTNETSVLGFPISDACTVGVRIYAYIT